MILNNLTKDNKIWDMVKNVETIHSKIYVPIIWHHAIINLLKLFLGMFYSNSIQHSFDYK